MKNHHLLSVYLSVYLSTTAILASSTPSVIWTFTGNLPAPYAPYPAYNITIPLNGVTIPIPNPLIIYTIAPFGDFPGPPIQPSSNCTFTLQDGTNVSNDHIFDIIPQRVVAVSCVPGQETVLTAATMPSSSSSKTPHSSTASVAIMTPPYPTATPVSSSHHNGSSTGAPSASATAVVGPGGVVPFTGDAGRLLQSSFSLTGSAAVVGLLGFWML